MRCRTGERHATIDRLGFTRVGTFDLRDPSLRFVEAQDAAARDLLASGEPATYVWVAASDDRPRYVGMAGRGIASRMKAHEGGFREQSGSPAGKAHAARIAADLAQGSASVWARKAERQVLFGVPTALYASEEQAPIAALRPKWTPRAIDDADYADRLAAAADAVSPA